MREWIVRNLISALGGKTVVSDRLGISGSAVANWYIYGLPKSRRSDLMELAQEVGLTGVTPTVLRAMDERHPSDRDLSGFLITPLQRDVFCRLAFGQPRRTLAASLGRTAEEVDAAIKELVGHGLLGRRGAVIPPPGKGSGAGSADDLSAAAA